MRILWLTWKDRTHPAAGGAELISSRIAQRLAADGHDVTVVTSRVTGAPSTELLDGYKVVRGGNRLTVYAHAALFVRMRRATPIDLVIEEVNTIPFLSRFYAPRDARRVLLFYQLCREIWFYQLPRLIGSIGFLSEPLYLRLLRGDPAIALSTSTQNDLVRHGFPAEDVSVMDAAIAMTPVDDLTAIRKDEQPTVVSLGSMRPMKRTLDQIRAFELAKSRIPDLRLLIAGEAGSHYGRRVLHTIQASPHRESIEYLGRIAESDKAALLSRAHVILVTSVKEGWGLIVTEAASQGTPAVVYDVDGLRDSVRDGETGVIVEPSQQALADGIVRLLSDPERYARVQRAGWEWSRELTLNRLYRRFSALALGANGS